ncbi:MAG TPA: FkbM family methyltransferase [Thermoplasmata archaeon]|nr:FkbM family methyltransferase [Thermoplasmata archaeon]
MSQAAFELAARALGRFTDVHQRPPFPQLYRRVVARLAQPGAVVEVDGQWMHLDRLDSLEIGARGEHEPVETLVCDACLRPGQTVVDLGANIGYFTLRFARAVGPEGHVFAFEPDAENYGLLVENIGRNGHGNVTAEPQAAGAVTGVAQLYRSATSHGDHRLRAAAELRPSVEVRVVALDDYPDLQGRVVDFAKVDIQGAEFDAVRGMQRILRETPAIRMLIEFCPYLLRRSGEDPGAFLNYLESLGLTVYHVDGRRHRIERVPFDQLLAHFDGGSDYSTNLFCARSPPPAGLRL